MSELFPLGLPDGVREKAIAQLGKVQDGEQMLFEPPMELFDVWVGAKKIKRDLAIEAAEQMKKDIVETLDRAIADGISISEIEDKGGLMGRVTKNPRHVILGAQANAAEELFWAELRQMILERYPDERVIGIGIRENNGNLIAIYEGVKQ